MKRLTTLPMFNASAKTLDFSTVSNFDPTRLLLVIDSTIGRILYNPSDSGHGGVWTSTVLTLSLRTITGAKNTDTILAFYDDGTSPISDDRIASAMSATGVAASNAFTVQGSNSGSPIPVKIPVGIPNSGQKKISVSGTAVALGSGALANGLIVKASAANAGNLMLGMTGVTVVDTGTGNGYKLQPGEAASIAAADLNQVFINGIAGDFVYFIGN